MNISQLDTDLSGYVGEKNRQRIVDRSKRPMLSNPFSLWRSAKNVDDIRIDMINKISLTMIGQQMSYIVTVTSDVQNIVASLLSTGIVVGALQGSRMRNNGFWKMMSKDAGGPKWRAIVGAMFMYVGTTDFLRMQLATIGPHETLYFANSIMYHYILFHLIYTRDELPKKKEEESPYSQNVLDSPV